MKRRQLVQLAGAALATSALSSYAQSFPAKPIRLIIAFPAGGPTDITMRSLADGASKILGQPVIIDNKPGAGGTLPAQTLQTSAADGYTLAQIPLGVFRLPYTTKINWDPVKDISYVLNVTGYAFGLVVPTESARLPRVLSRSAKSVRYGRSGVVSGSPVKAVAATLVAKPLPRQVLVATFS